MLNDFKAFIARGNLLDLAIGFILGAAFSTLVKTFTEGMIMPVVGLLTGGVDFSSKCYNLTNEQFASCSEAVEKGIAVIQYGQFITDIITFLIVAIVMFFIARWALKLFASMAPEDAPKPEIELLTEIRDALKNK
ncbi:MAG: large conductance mechanosensitive channel protein MscL [Pyrinomonadaceae bacterium]